MWIIGTALAFYTMFFPGVNPVICPGDANGDGVVNILDLSLTASNLGKGTAPYAYGDVNGDMIVTMADLNLEAAYYGVVCYQH